MKKSIFIIIACFVCSSFSFAQNTIQSAQMIGITPIMCEALDIPEAARKSVTQKLVQMATKNGFGSSSGNFIITANPVIVEKQMTPTAPAQFIIDIDLSIFVINVAEMVIVNEMTLSLKGINRLENKAFISAINSFQTNNPKVRVFMDKTRNKIVDYYSTQVPTLLAKAKSMADREDYNGALKLLASIPDFIDQYPAVLELMNNVYNKTLELETLMLIKEAKVEIINGNYIQAMDVILTVNPLSPNAEQAFAMIDEVNDIFVKKRAQESAERQRVIDEEKRRFDAKRADMLTMHNDEVTLEKMRILAISKDDSVKPDLASGMNNEDLSNQIFSLIMGN